MGIVKEKLIGRGCLALKSLVVLLAVMSMNGQAWAGVTYGWIDIDGQSSDSTKIAYYNTLPLILSNEDSVKGFAELAGGFHTDGGGGTFALTNLAAPIAKDIYLHNGDQIDITGDLTLSTTSIEANGNFIIHFVGNDLGYNQTLYLAKDTSLPAGTITLGKALIIDGQGNTVTFNASTVFNLDNNVLTLKNMVIKGLSGGDQFIGNGTLKLQNCVIDLATGTTFTYDNADLTIADDVVVQGGGTLRFAGTGFMTINEFSTLYIDQDTTFDYACATRGLISTNSATSTLHLNGATLKATEAQGLQLRKGRLFLEGKCLLDNGSNSSASNGIQFGDGANGNDVKVKVFPGAQVQVSGYVFHNPDLDAGD